MMLSTVLENCFYEKKNKINLFNVYSNIELKKKMRMTLSFYRGSQVAKGCLDFNASGALFESKTVQ